MVQLVVLRIVAQVGYLNFIASSFVSKRCSRIVNFGHEFSVFKWYLKSYFLSAYDGCVVLIFDYVDGYVNIH